MGGLRVLMFVCCATAVSLAAEIDYTKSLAYQKEVHFLPTPDYKLTMRDGTDSTDLTDGRLYTYHSPMLWFDRHAVGFSYAGQAQLQVDLGAVKPIDEVGIRLQHGRPPFPGIVEVIVSDDGRRYFRIASCSKWDSGDWQRYSIPPDDGQSRIVPLRFGGLRTRGRYVVIRMYCTSLTCSDELWVMAGKHAPASVKFNPDDEVDFTITGPQLYFHKPVIKFAADLALPIPVGILVGDESKQEPVTVTVDVPAGVDLAGLGAKALEQEAKPSGQAIEAGTFTRYVLRMDSPSSSQKSWLRIFLTATWREGQKGSLRYQVNSETYTSPLTTIPIEAIKSTPAPAPRRILTTLGWYSAAALAQWPDWLRAFRTLGMNTVSSFAHWMKPDDDIQWGLIDKARAQGFKLLNIDSAFHRIKSKTGEYCCQFADGTHGEKFCPSYRGELYRNELDRIADETTRMKANYLFTDIELWNWRGPVDSKKCIRCKADFEKSGMKDWGEWQLAKGYEMWTDMVKAVCATYKDAGLPKLEFGCYDFQPGKNYQFFWPFDRLYPEFMQSSQVSTYTPLEPYHIALVGDEVRGDREKLPRSDVLPWITPGDAGTFDGDSFRYALWECYTNGARGVLFWSGRVWDAENLVALGRAIKAIAPVEDIILDGELLKDVSVQPPARVSGMRRGGDIVLLVADYAQESHGKLHVTLLLAKPSTVTSLDTSEVLARLPAGKAKLDLNLKSERALLLHIKPDTH